MIYSVIPYDVIFAQENIEQRQVRKCGDVYFETDQRGACRLLSTNPADFLSYDILPSIEQMK